MARGTEHICSEGDDAVSKMLLALIFCAPLVARRWLFCSLGWESRVGCAFSPVVFRRFDLTSATRYVAHPSSTWFAHVCASAPRISNPIVAFCACECQNISPLSLYIVTSDGLVKLNLWRSRRISSRMPLCSGSYAHWRNRSPGWTRSSTLARWFLLFSPYLIPVVSNGWSHGQPRLLAGSTCEYSWSPRVVWRRACYSLTTRDDTCSRARNFQWPTTSAGLTGRNSTQNRVSLV